MINKAVYSYPELITIFSRDKFFNINESAVCFGISTDSRTLEKGNAFVALKGETFDGHDKIDEVFEKGALIAVVDEGWLENNQSYKNKYSLISVKDTLTSLHKLAKFHRNRFKIPILAIGGANGKTTTKNMTAHLLSKNFSVHKTFENFNNQVGVPMMLLSLDDSYDIAVLEIGTNEPGEISILSNMIEPTHGLITNIGKEHLEKLIDLDGVEFEETFLFGFLHKRNGTAFINFDDERLKKYSKILENAITFSSIEDAKIKAEIQFNERLNPSINFLFEGRSFLANLKTNGHTTALNAIAATSIALYFGLTDEEIVSGLESYEEHLGHGYARMVIERINNFTLLNDCYNANPDSMSAALNSLKQIVSKGKKIAVLGDMRELGEASSNEHLNLLRKAIGNADMVFITGIEMQKAFNSEFRNSEIKYFDDKISLFNNLADNLKGDETIMVKGSRGMAMESIIKLFKERFSIK